MNTEVSEREFVQILCARSHLSLPPVPAARTIHLDARFERGGAWSGVSELVDEAYSDLIAHGRREHIDRHNYELHMALRERRAEIPLQYASLTDAAIGAERTRNFPLDRAYRIVNGLVSFVQQWKALYERESWTIIVHNFFAAQHLARRFFFEMTRRLSGSGITVVVEISGALPAEELRLHGLDAQSAEREIGATSPLAARAVLTGRECDELEQNSRPTMEWWEQHYPALLESYRLRGRHFDAARVALRAICLYNHYGYYHESSSFAAVVLPHFDALVEDDQIARWNYVGNIFQGLVTTGREREALRMIEERAVPWLTTPVLQAKMHYLLAMIHARYLRPHDIPAAERHILLAVDAVEAAKPDVPSEEYSFLKVFIGNGLAFIRVRQSRMSEALQLCESGFQYLTAQVGEQKHRLHRSVLLYNCAQVYLFLNNYDRALASYDQAIAMDPHYSEYYNESANVMQQLGRYREAIVNYDKAICYSAPYPEVYYNKAVCLSRMGELERALGCLSSSEELNPMQPELFALRAELLDELGKAEQAYESYTLALELAPDLVTARVNRAVLCFNRGEYGQALADMSHAICVDGGEAAHYENRAAIYSAMGKPDLAMNDLRRAEEARRAA